MCVIPTEYWVFWAALRKRCMESHSKYGVSYTCSITLLGLGGLYLSHSLWSLETGAQRLTSRGVLCNVSLCRELCRGDLNACHTSEFACELIMSDQLFAPRFRETWTHFNFNQISQRICWHQLRFTFAFAWSMNRPDACAIRSKKEQENTYFP